MPFPFAAIGAIGSAIAGAAATAAGVAATAATAVAAVAATSTTVAVGATVVGGLAITHSIIKHNNKVKNNAYAAGQRAASQANERRLLEKKRRLDAKVKNLKEEYGSDVSEEEQKQILLESSEILGGLQGNRSGLEEKGQSASFEAIQAEKELKDLQNEFGLKEQDDSDVSGEEQKKLLLESSKLLGSLDGNRIGLEKQGQFASSAEVTAEKELQELKNSLGLNNDYGRFATHGARRVADRENERRLVEEKKRLDAKIQRLRDQYSRNASEEEQKKIFLEILQKSLGLK